MHTRKVENKPDFNPRFITLAIAEESLVKIMEIFTRLPKLKGNALSYVLKPHLTDNASSCDLLAQRLDDYTNTVYQDGKNIYNSLLIQAHPDIATRCKFQVPKNLPKIDLNSHFKTLNCSDNKLFCNESEKISKAEFNQFANLFTRKNETASKLANLTNNKVNLEDRFENLDRLQKPETIQYPAKSNYNNREGTSRNKEISLPSFVTARDEFENQQALNKFGVGGKHSYSDESLNGGQRKSLGTRKTTRSKFVSPLLSKKDSYNEADEKMEVIIDERLKNIEPKMVELIMAEIMDQGPSIDWNDIAGLEFAKSAIQEAVVWPMLRPDIFTGLRRPPKGILLFGPPGTGKTLIGKCVASQSKSTFFSISASSLTSKWIGDGEKMVRALFAVARVHQPAVIFIDEVDSLLTQRSSTEHECSRRIKTEFLVQLDGATTDSEERLLVIGATNRPQELDEAARRRFVKRLYIPLPDFKARLDLLNKLMSTEKHLISEEQFSEIARLSEGYSGADIKNLCSEAAFGPIRCIDFKDIENIQASEVRPLTVLDFEKSLRTVRPSVSQNDLVHYINWDNTYGFSSNS